MTKVRTGEVFVAGGQPTVTYNPREDLALEGLVRDYLNERHKILAVSGPTKSGKTVLLRRVVADRIWVPGGDVHSLDDFWAMIGDEVGAYTSEEVATGSSETTGTDTRVGGGARPLGLGASVDRTTSRADTTDRQRREGRTRPVRLAAKEELLRSKPTLVIDDFHYIDASVQERMIRGLKDLVFEGVGVVLASVPHRSYDAVRVEQEMTGRVEQLQVPFWSQQELLTIASEGFTALNVSDPMDHAGRLAKESFSSPFLMQDFLLQLMKVNGVEETVATNIDIAAPDDWDQFFSDRAMAGSKPAFDMLSQGPRQRADRKERTLTAGGSTDIYGAVLAAIAHTGPLTELRYVDLRQALREVLADEVPQQHEVTRVLEQMTKIARERLEGEPVVDWDAELETLHISDPYFAFYLRWAVRRRGTT